MMLERENAQRGGEADMHAIQKSSGRKCEAMSVGKTVRDLNSTRQTGRDGGVWETKRTKGGKREVGIAGIIIFHLIER